MRNKTPRALAALSLTAFFVFGVAACSETSSEALPEAHASTTQQADSGASEDLEAAPLSDVIIIDVRSPEEFAEGHVAGALNLDFNSGEFAEAITGLDPDATYALYCRSGNRSGQAAALLAGAGFTSVADLGPLEQASGSLGLPITK